MNLNTDQSKASRFAHDDETIDFLLLPRVQPEHWALWAYECREPGYVRIGYHRENELYTPPRLGDTVEGLQPKREQNPEDVIVARQIAKGVEALRHVDHRGAMHLVNWHGAYGGAPMDRGQRILMMGIARNRAREVVQVWEAWVQGWVECFQGGLRKG